MVIEKAQLFVVIGGVAYDATLTADSWQSWDVTHSREVLKSSEKTTSFSLKFVGDVRDRLINLFETYYQNAQAVLRVVDIDTSNVNEYDLDFATYIKDDDFVEIACRVVDLYTAIKKNGNTEYDIDFNSIKLSKQLYYERMDQKNEVYMSRTEMSYKKSISIYSNNYHPGFSFESAEVPVKDRVMYSDSSGNQTEFVAYENLTAPYNIIRAGTYTIEYISDCDTVATTFAATILADRDLYDDNITGYEVHYRLFATTPEDTDVLLTDQMYTTSELSVSSPAYLSRYHAFSNTTKETVLVSYTGEFKEATKIYMRISIVRIGSGIVTFEQPYEMWYSYCGSGNLKLSYTGQASEPRAYNVANTATLLKALFAKMGEYDVNVTATDSDLDKLVYIPHDVINGYTLPIITTSFNKLEKFLQLYFYGLVIDGNNVTVLPMANTDPSVYNRTLVHDIEFTEEECADLEVSPYTDIVYSEIVINYNANTGEGVNADDEPNKTTTFTTAANSANKLELISSYRTDSIGFDLAIPQRESDDNDRKKDIYVITTTANPTDFYMPETVVLDSNRTVFNADLFPTKILEKWSPFLSCSSDTLVLASTDIVNVPSTSTNMILSNLTRWDVLQQPILHPVSYNIATSDDKDLLSRSLLNGVMQFIYDGTTYIGYVQQIQENPLIRQSQEYTLIKQGDNTYLSYPISVKLDNVEMRAPSYLTNISFTFSVTGLQVTNINHEIDTNGIGSVASYGSTVYRNKITVTAQLTPNPYTTERVTIFYCTIMGTRYTVCTITQNAMNSNDITMLPDVDASFSANGELNETKYVLRMDNVEPPTEVLVYQQSNIMRYGTSETNNNPYGVSLMASTELDVENGIIRVTLFGRSDVSGRSALLAIRGESWSNAITADFN